MAMKPTPLDPADVLKTEEAIKEYRAAAAETGDIVFQADCERVIALARKRWGLPEEG